MKKLLLLTIVLGLVGMAHAQQTSADAEVKEAVKGLWGDKANGRVQSPSKPSLTKKSTPTKPSASADYNIGIEELTIALGGYESSTDSQKKASYDAETNLSKAYISKAKTTKDVINILARNLGVFYRSASAYNASAVQISQIADEANVRLSALTVAQNQRIIEQNDEIIKLLKIQVNKK